ncbi:MAG TPA: DPP IV N-terminal domain-containing protein [Acidimicrobiales bacterium]|nr:DPP IV N-terminal domain-containing protein [Acidimicrobiales bacterium]
MTIPLEEVARHPLPGTLHPTALAFSPDDRHLTFLRSVGGTLRRELVALVVATGEESVLAGAEGGATEADLSLEERLRRERQRELGLGVTRYAWADEADRLLVPGPGGLDVIDGVGGPGRTLLADAPSALLDPRLSPDGSLVAHVVDGEVHVVPADGSGPARQVTSGASEAGRTHGLAEFVAQEELDRPQGLWWAPDGRALAVAEVDERRVPVYRIVHQGADEVGEGAHEDHRYPFAGADNALVRLGVVAVPGEGEEPSEIVWADLPDLAGGYLARVGWLSDGALAVQVLDRAQGRLDLHRVDPATGSSTCLLTEESDVWVNVHGCFRALPDGGFLWASERSGFRHLEVRAADGGLVRTLTAGDWMVDGVAAVDVEPADGSAGTVWCTGTLDGPTERHLYAVALDGASAPVRLTSEPGIHAVVVDHGCRRFVDTHNSATSPPTVVLRSLVDGAAERTVFDEADPRVAALDLQPPELTTVTTADGTTLHAALYRPAGEGPFPTVVAVYGGPHAQMVTDSWARTVAMRAQHLRGLGYLVVSVDNRGSWGRGLAFEGAVRHDLGSLEIADQVDALRDLAGRGLVDLGRVGIYGWSYGGYLSAMALAKAPDVFRVAVAGAPVTSWDGYDTCYTERYMGTPASNPEGYRRSSVMTHAEAIRGRLLLVHGLIDENVHFRHTARLVNALIRARVDHELQLFPDERHVPRGEADRVFMEERVVGFLEKHLSGAAPGRGTEGT